MSALPPIAHVAQWAAEQKNAGATDIAGMVADYVLATITSPELPADRLAGIQRQMEPIDDDGTLRQQFNRSDMEALMVELLRLRGRQVPTPEPEVATTLLAHELMAMFAEDAA